MIWLLVLGIGLFAGTLAGIIGFGGTTILLPILTYTFGPENAVPIMAIASIMGNLSRVTAWWREIDWRAVAAFSAMAIPAAWLGARTMVALDPRTLELCLGVFFIAMIPMRRWFLGTGFKVSLPVLAMAGGGVGYVTGIVSNTGPINTPFFLAYGLTKGAFVGTEAMSSLSMFASKVAAFRVFGAMPNETILKGLIVGSSLMIGTYIAKRFMRRINENMFKGLMDILLGVSGTAMIIGAI